MIKDSVAHARSKLIAEPPEQRGGTGLAALELPWIAVELVGEVLRDGAAGVLRVVDGEVLRIVTFDLSDRRDEASAWRR